VDFLDWRGAFEDCALGTDMALAAARTGSTPFASFFKLNDEIPDYATLEA